MTRQAVYIAAALAALAAVCGFTGTVEAQQALRQTDVQALNELEKGFAQRFRVEHAAAVLWAQQQRIAKLRFEQPDGRIVELDAKSGPMGSWKDSSSHPVRDREHLFVFEENES